MPDTTVEPTASTPRNPLGMRGISFVEFASPDPAALDALFRDMGFSLVARHRDRALDLYRQHEITFVLNREPASAGARFSSAHGPSISAMGWRYGDARAAHRAALARGARPCEAVDLRHASGGVPAVYGIGDSLLYFVDEALERDGLAALGFVPLERPELVPDAGFVRIDHLTNNVFKGTMGRWAEFYKSVFGFTEVRYFDIRGVKTGLTSYALRSPCGTFCIPINEADEARSQINEYLDEYRGPGVQHLAFLTRDILASLRALEARRAHVGFLDIEPGYYESVFNRVPGVREDRGEIARRNVLVDGDADGYLLQIFTRNVVGPIFIELIQRENHASFGEGNFGALFRSIERDQARRGVFDAPAR